jgi:hypothetical protein
VHQTEAPVPEWLRLIIAMANKRLVISEPMSHSDPLVPGRHFIQASPQEFSASVSRYLSRPDEYDKITTEAYGFLTTNYRIDTYLLRFIEDLTKWKR